MSASLDKLREWMEGNEDEHLESNEAKSDYDFEELVRYCAAGGTLVHLLLELLPIKTLRSNEEAIAIYNYMFCKRFIALFYCCVIFLSMQCQSKMKDNYV